MPYGVEVVSVGKASVFAVGTNVLQILGGFATAALLARFLGPLQKGIYDMYLATSMLLAVLLSLALNAGVTYTVASQPVNSFKLLRALAFIGAGESAAVFVVMYSAGFIGCRSLLVPFELGSSGVPAIALMVFLVSVSTFYRAVLVGYRQFIKANYGDVSKQVLGVSFLLALYPIKHLTHINPLHWTILASMVVMAVTIVNYGSRVPQDNSGASDTGLGCAFRFAMPAYLANASQYLNNRIDLFFVYRYHGAAHVGIYQTAGLIGQAISLLPSAVQGILVPTIASGRLSRKETVATVARAHRLLFSVGALIAISAAAAGPIVVPLVFGKAFAATAVSLALLVPGCAISITTTVLAAYFAGTGRPHINMAISIAVTVITIALDALVVPVWSFYGASVISSFSYIFAAACSVFVFKKETGMPLSHLYILTEGDLKMGLEYFQSAVAKTRQQGRA
jgi:O-antigen/teichoic acid export membrane protein